MATYYIATTGNNSNPGTVSLPFLTGAKGVSVAVAGDTIIFEDGIYLCPNGSFQMVITVSGTSTNYITIKSRNIGGAILNGNGNLGIAAFSVRASYINISGFEIKGMLGVGVEVSNGFSYINFSDLHIHDIGRGCFQNDDGRTAFTTGNGNHIVIERCLIHTIGSYAPGESGCTYTAGWTGYQTLDHGVYIAGTSYLSIINNIFYDCKSGFAIQFYSGSGFNSSNVVISNNTFYNGNPYQAAGHIILWNNVSDSLIINNIFDTHTNYAVRAYQGSYTYSNVIISNNMTYGGNGETVTSNATGVLISNNLTNTNPLFVNKASHNFILQGTSPAINAGYNTDLIPWLDKDYLKNSRVGVTDIGAYEYQTAVTTTTSSTTTTINNNITPVIILNTPNNISLTDNTPILNFKGTDPQNDNIEYQIQIDTVNVFNSQAGVNPVIIDSCTQATDESVILGAIDNDGVGQCFTSQSNSVLTSVKFYLFKTNFPTGNVNVRLYAITGTYGVNAVPTGPILAYSDNFDISTITSSLLEYEFTFSGANRYNLVGGTKYAVMLQYINGGTVSDYFEVGRRISAPNNPGNYFLYDGGSYYPNFGVNADLPFKVYAISNSPLINAVSTIDTGFTIGHPFISGVSKEYTVQSSLPANTYYWRVRAIDVSGSNIYGSWSSIQNFIINAVTTTSTTIAPVNGATYYISPTGVYSNPGTYNSPFNWLKGQSVLQPGDTLIFKNGLYTSTVHAYTYTSILDGTVNSRITYKAETNGQVILDGGNFEAYDAFSLGNYSNGGASYITIEGFEIRNYFYSGMEIQNSDFVIIRDCWIHHIGNTCTEDGSGLVGIGGSNCDNMIVERCTINNIGRLGLGENGCTPTSDYWKNHDHGVYVGKMTNMIIRNNIFYNNIKGWSIQFYGTGDCNNVQIINNSFYNGAPRSEVGSHVIIYLNMANCLIANNIFHTHYTTGISIDDGTYYTFSNILITKNIVYGGTGLILKPSLPPSGVTVSNNYQSINPLYVNEASYDFNLQLSSPAIDSGYDTGLATDFLNNPRSIIDIGALEYQNNIITTTTTTINVPTWYNVRMSATATKNDCITGKRGSIVTYIVIAYKYSSFISQGDANFKAAADLEANKQIYANANGYCNKVYRCRR